MNTANNTVIDWYRTPLGPGILEALNNKNNLKGLLQAGGHLCLIITTGTLSVHVYYNHSWILLLPIIFLHGTIAAFLSNACHEFVHGTVFSSRILNKFFLYTFSFLRWFPPEYYWKIHTAHHQYTLYSSLDRDPELFPYENEPGVIKRVTFREFFTKEFINPFNLMGTIRRNVQHSRGKLKDEWEYGIFAGNESRQKVFNWARILLAGHLTITTISLYFGNWIIPVIVSLLPCYGGWLQFLCNHAQHAGLKKDLPDFRLSCRTNYLNPILQFLYWHMNFHIEHHMYAAVPCYNLGKLHRAIKNDLPPVLNGLGPVWQEIIAIQHRQIEDPDYCYLQQLPGQISTQQKAPSLILDDVNKEKDVQSAGDSTRVWQCSICGYTYSEALGLPDDGIPPGTSWDSIPDDWVCPDCGAGKSDFEMEEV